MRSLKTEGLAIPLAQVATVWIGLIENRITAKVENRIADAPRRIRAL